MLCRLRIFGYHSHLRPWWGTYRVMVVWQKICSNNNTKKKCCWPEIFIDHLVRVSRLAIYEYQSHPEFSIFGVIFFRVMGPSHNTGNFQNDRVFKNFKIHFLLNKKWCWPKLATKHLYRLSLFASKDFRRDCSKKIFNLVLWDRPITRQVPIQALKWLWYAQILSLHNVSWSSI